MLMKGAATPRSLGIMAIGPHVQREQGWLVVVGRTWMAVRVMEYLLGSAVGRQINFTQGKITQESYIELRGGCGMSLAEGLKH